MPPGRSVLILEYLKFWGKNLQKAAYEHDITRMCEKTYKELLINVFFYYDGENLIFSDLKYFREGSERLK